MGTGRPAGAWVVSALLALSGCTAGGGVTAAPTPTASAHAVTRDDAAPAGPRPVGPPVASAAPSAPPPGPDPERPVRPSPAAPPAVGDPSPRAEVRPPAGSSTAPPPGPAPEPAPPAPRPVPSPPVPVPLPAPLEPTDPPPDRPTDPAEPAPAPGPQPGPPAPVPGPADPAWPPAVPEGVAIRGGPDPLTVVWVAVDAGPHAGDLDAAVARVEAAGYDGVQTPLSCQVAAWEALGVSGGSAVGVPVYFAEPGHAASFVGLFGPVAAVVEGDVFCHFS